MSRPLDRDLLAGPTLEAARGLVGAHLVREPARPGQELRRGRIVEVEGYIGEDDRASHARFGRTGRNAVMFGPPGIAYVYLVYGMYDCLNIVTEPPGHPAAVLVRAVEPLEGLATMRAARVARRVARTRRTVDVAATASTLDRVTARRLTAGPGLVAAAFDIDRDDTGVDLLDPGSPLRLEAPPADEPRPTVVATPRIGIDYAAEPWRSLPWRFVIADRASRR